MKQKDLKAYYQEEKDWVLLRKENGVVIVREDHGQPPEEIIEHFHGTRLEASDRAVALENGDFTENSLFDFGLKNGG